MAEIDKEKIDFFCNHFFKILLNTIKLTQYFKFWFYFEEQTFSFIIKRKDITKICSKYAKMLKYWNIVKIGLIVKLGPLTLYIDDFSYVLAEEHLENAIMNTLFS